MTSFFSLNNRRYLGAKTKLLGFINEIIEKEFEYEKNTFLDLFAGTGVVGYEFSDSFKNIYTNDLLVHNYMALNTFFSNEKIDLDLIKSEIDKCNQIKGSFNYYSKNFGDKFFSLENAKKIGSINTVINKAGYLKGYNTDWIAVKRYFEVREFKSIYIIGNGGFSKAVQYVCDIMNIQFEIITRDNWELIEKLNNQTLFNATPIYIKTDNHLIDARPTEIVGKTIAKYQAEEQLKIYVGVVSG